MSTWEDLFNAESGHGSDEPMPDPVPLRRPDEALQVGTSGVLDALEDMAKATTWPCSQGEPPPHIARWAVLNGGRLELARCCEGGWWWVSPGQVPSSQGWPWSKMKMSDAVLAPVYPDLTDTDGRLDESLLMALPNDGKWYRIGTNQGVPVWGSHACGDEDDMSRYVVRETRPEEDE